MNIENVGGNTHNLKLTLNIEGTIIADYLKSYDVDVKSIYDEGSGFKAIDGTQQKTYLGDRRTLKARFEPMSTKQINELFGLFKSVDDTAPKDVSITYTDPQFGENHTANFYTDSLPAASYFEGETNKGNTVLFWTLPDITLTERAPWESG